MIDLRDERFWNEMGPEMRRALHLEPLSDDEAARAFEEAPELPLSEDQIAEFARIAAASVPREPSYLDRTAERGAEIDQEVGEVLELHRNEGEDDAEIEERMNQQAEEALGDDDDEDEETDAEETQGP